MTSTETESTTCSIVLIEDAVLVRIRIRQLLERIPGVRIIGEAESGNQGLRLLESVAPDLVVLDLMMPDGNGFKVLAEARLRGLDCRFVVLSTLADGVARRRVQEAGAAAFFDKATEFDDFLDWVRAEIRASQEGPPPPLSGANYDGEGTP